MEFGIEKITKTVWICERPYKMSMLKEEEEAFDSKIKAITQKLSEFKNKFKTFEDIDYLAMCLISIATESINDDPKTMSIFEIETKIKELNFLLERTLTQEDLQDLT